MADDNKIVDYSSYDGPHQEGELLDEEGNPIHPDELRQQEMPPKTPLPIKIGFVVLFVVLALVVYLVFMRAPAPLPVTKAPPKKIDYVLELALSQLNKTRGKDYRLLFDCWRRLVRHQSNPAYIKGPAQLKQSCPAMRDEAPAQLRQPPPPPKEGEKKEAKKAPKEKAPQKRKVKLASDFRIEPLCKDGCKKIVVQRCNGSSCKELDIDYIDFIYMMMLRVGSGYNIVYAYQQLYQRKKNKAEELQEKFSSKMTQKGEGESTKVALSPEAKAAFAQAKALKEKLRAHLTAEGMKQDSWRTPYYGLARKKVYLQALARIRHIKKGPEAEKEEKKEEEKKRRRRRRRRRRGGEKPLWGGRVDIPRQWPVAAMALDAYKTLERFFNLEDQADQVPSIQYTPVSLNFWTSVALQKPLILCDYKKKAKKTTKVWVKTTFDNTGQLVDGINISKVKEAELKECINSSLPKLFYKNPPRAKKKTRILFLLRFIPS